MKATLLQSTFGRSHIQWRRPARQLHFLARHFTVCDRWFSSVPGPTLANRFFVHTGTACGIAPMTYPGDPYDVSDFPEFRRSAFVRPFVDPDFATDQWGIFVSGFAGSSKAF
jgi:phospholipase C